MPEKITNDMTDETQNNMTKEQAEKIDNTIKRIAPNGLKIKKESKSNIKKVIGVVSGKGGVGKSLVTSLLATGEMKAGLKTAILDGDITGPSIPKLFGVKDKAHGIGENILPVRSKSGIEIMSMNALLDDETQPVIWRGPVIAGAVKQFWTDVLWGDVDVMLVDMPPGTGDVPLTVFQSIPISGIVVVTSPQELVEMIVSKAVSMAERMNIPILGIVENMSYYECPECHHRHEIFGKSRVQEIADKYGIKAVSKIPVNPEIAAMSDDGRAEELDPSCLSEIFDAIITARMSDEVELPELHS